MRRASLGLLFFCVACAPSPERDAEPFERRSTAIVGGVSEHDAGDGGDASLDASAPPRTDADAVVAIVRDGNRLCTGALVAPDVVLTARHCVSRTNGLDSRCDREGNETGGATFTADEAPGSLRVFVGAKPDLRAAPAAVGKAVKHDGAKAPCNADVALVVLDRAIMGITPLALRLGGPVSRGELVRAVGYGRTEANTIGERRHRDGVRTLAVGPGVSPSGVALGAREIETSQGFCDGDSGGPALSTTGAVVAVVSRGPACDVADGYVYATLPGFRALFEGIAVRREMGDVDLPTAGDASIDDAAAGDDAGERALPMYDRGLGPRCTAAPASRFGSDDDLSSVAAALIIVLLLRRVTSERFVCNAHKMSSSRTLRARKRA